MSRYRIKTLLNAVWAIIDAEFEAAEAETFSVEYKAREMALRNSIVETLDNPALKGKRLVKEVEAQVQELIRMKRQHAEAENGMKSKTRNDVAQSERPDELWVLLRTEGDSQAARLCTCEDACINAEAKEYECDPDSKAKFSYFDVSEQARSIAEWRLRPTCEPQPHSSKESTAASLADEFEKFFASKDNAVASPIRKENQ